jgi:hypothetical protein
MANCVRCGFELSQASSVCAKCGAPATYAPRRRFGAILGVLAGALYLGIVGLVIGAHFYVTRHPNVFPHARSATPTAFSRPDPSNELGIALYPGQHGFIPRINNPSGKIRSLYYATDGSIEDVKAFYRAKYGDSVTIRGDDHSATLAFRFASNDLAMVTVTNHSTPAEEVTHLAYSRILTSNDRPRSSPGH